MSSFDQPQRMVGLKRKATLINGTSVKSRCGQYLSKQIFEKIERNTE